MKKFGFWLKFHWNLFLSVPFTKGYTLDTIQIQTIYTNCIHENYFSITTFISTPVVLRMTTTRVWSNRSHYNIMPNGCYMISVSNYIYLYICIYIYIYMIRLEWYFETGTGVGFKKKNTPLYHFRDPHDRNKTVSKQCNVIMEYPYLDGRS